MKTAARAIFATLLGLATARGAEWSDYKPASLQEASSAASVVPDSDYTIESANVKFLVEARYTGRHREIESSRRELLRRWAKALRHSPEIESAFNHEVELADGEKVAWLLLQDPLVEPFAAEAHADSRVRAHIMYIGAIQSTLVFAVNRFQVLPR